MPDQNDRAQRSSGYAKGRATKQAIVEHAAAAFAQKGFYGTSLRGIAREAGIDHAALLHHFGGKDALLLAVIDWYDAQHGMPEFERDYPGEHAAGAATPPSTPPAIPPELLIEGIVAAAGRNAARPGLIRLFSVISAEAGLEGHPARAALQQRHARLIEVFAAGIRARREHLGRPEAGMSDEERAVLLISTWEGLQVFDALHPDRVDLPALLGRALERLI